MTKRHPGYDHPMVGSTMPAPHDFGDWVCELWDDQGSGFRSPTFTRSDGRQIGGQFCINSHSMWRTMMGVHYERLEEKAKNLKGCPL